MRRSTLLVAISLLISTAAHADPDSIAAANAPGREGEAAVASPTDKQHWSDLDALLRNAVGHPNETWRLQGADAASQGRWHDAFEHFRRASRYADKYSQHRISLMYWHGVGVARDRALAYAWADLAAERMYPQFVLLREKMWQELGEHERATAVEAGQAIYDEFGDAVAKPRFADALAQAKRQVTGSRTGFVGTLIVQAPGPGTSLTGTGGPGLGELYAQSRWDSEHYWKVEDAVWHNGSVEVGALEKINDATPPVAGGETPND